MVAVNMVGARRSCSGRSRRGRGRRGRSSAWLAQLLAPRLGVACVRRGRLSCCLDVANSNGSDASFGSSCSSVNNLIRMAPCIWTWTYFIVRISIVWMPPMDALARHASKWIRSQRIYGLVDAHILLYLLVRRPPRVAIGLHPCRCIYMYTCYVSC